MVSHKPNTLALLTLAGLLLTPVDGGARVAIVIPTGQGPGLTATAAVGRRIVKQIKKRGSQKAKLVYVLPDFPPPKRGLERKAGRLMKKAHKDFQMMEYDRATQGAEDALKLYKDLAKHNKGAGYVEAQHLIAASAFFAGNNSQASKAMNDAYLANPTPPPKRFSPQVQDLYNQVVSEAPSPGAVQLKSAPEGALIWFHNKLVGPAQGKIRIRSGLYLVRAYLPGHTVYQRWFRVRPHDTRNLLAVLQKDGTAEPETMRQVREEAREEEPGAAQSQVALNAGADEVVLLTPAADCMPRHCPISVRWARDGRWYRRKNGTFTGRNANQLASMWVRGTTTSPLVRDPGQPPAITPILPPGAEACTLDSQCGFRESCVSGRCQTVTPITHKWWFWTLIAVGVAGATTAIVVPLTRPEAPVINLE